MLATMVPTSPRIISHFITSRVIPSNIAIPAAGAVLIGGNEYIDQIESLCQRRALAAYHLDAKHWSAVSDATQCRHPCGVSSQGGQRAALLGQPGQLRGSRLGPRALARVARRPGPVCLWRRSTRAC